jgi:hypothetical protein
MLSKPLVAALSQLGYQVADKSVASVLVGLLA